MENLDKEVDRQSELRGLSEDQARADDESFRKQKEKVRLR